MATSFRDFIPEGEDTGAQGNGFQDFVPPKEPQKVILPEETPVTPQEKPTKKK